MTYELRTIVNDGKSRSEINLTDESDSEGGINNTQRSLEYASR